MFHIHVVHLIKGLRGMALPLTASIIFRTGLLAVLSSVKMNTRIPCPEVMEERLTVRRWRRQSDVWSSAVTHTLNLFQS